MSITMYQKVMSDNEIKHVNDKLKPQMLVGMSEGEYEHHLLWNLFLLCTGKLGGHH